MNTQSLLNIFNTMINENIIYTFHGEFNYKMIDTLLTDVKREINKSDLEVLTQKKTYKVLVECLENVYRHSSGNKKDISEKQEGIFVLTRNENGYGVIVGNSIHPEDAPSLKEKLDEVNALNKDELKERYKAMIKTTTISENGGAGLGIMDIAIKSGSKLNYNFNEHKNNMIFFTLEIQITG